MRTFLILASVMMLLMLVKTAAAQESGGRPDRPAVYLRFDHGQVRATTSPSTAPATALVAGASTTWEGVDLTRDYTIEWWQFVQNVENAQPIVRIGVDEAGVLPLPKAKASDPARATFAFGKDPVRSRTMAYADKWYHVAVVGHGGMVQFFVNGEPDGEPVAHDLKPAGQISIGNEVMGKNPTGGEVAVFDHALSAETIRRHFQARLQASAGHDIKTAGHRGINRYAPENTRISYVQAVEAGIAIVEMDLSLTRDGHIVLMHDPTVNRTTNGKGKVADFMVDDITRLDAGKWKDAKYAGEPVPRIEQIATVCRDKAIMMLDLKSTGQGKQIAEWLRSMNYRKDGIILAPWTDEEGIALRQYLPDVTMIRLTSKVPTNNFDDAYFARMKQIGFSWFSVDWKNLSQAFIDAAHQNGMKIYAWTINEPSEIAGAVLAGVDGIISDDPVATKKFIATIKPH